MWGHLTIIIQHHIPKHHIPELPNHVSIITQYMINRLYCNSRLC